MLNSPLKILFQVEQGLGRVGCQKAEADELVLRVERAEGGGVCYGKVSSKGPSV